MPPTKASLTIDIHKPEVDFLCSWAGPVGRSATRLAQQTVIAQKVLAPKKTGRLAKSIKWTRGINAKGITFTTYSTVPYAKWMEEGTRPHIIRPKKPGGYLVFYWAKAGRVVWLRSVRHPGTRAYHFLRDGAKAAMKAWERTG